MATQAKRYKQQPMVPPFLAHMVVTGMAILFLVVGGFTGYLFFHAVKDVTKELVARTNLSSTTSHKVDLALPLAVLPLSGDGNTLPILNLPIPMRGGDTGATGITGVPLPNYEKKERVNILLLGIDKRPDDTLARTDTMIVVTVDPNGKSAGMLSIPRDLYVPIPGYEGEDRINKAYYLGEKDDYPGGGPALAMKTIQNNLGIPIHFYAQIDFNGFREIVDTLDGIDVFVEETIDDPTYPDENYGYNPFYIEAGQHTLNGHDALRYARTRHTAGSDFSRAKRQQQVLLAIRDKALQLNMIPKIPELWDTLSDSIDTNLQLIDIIELAQLINEIDAKNIESAVIDHDYTVDYVTDTGAQVLLPLWEKIQILVGSIFTETESTGPTEAQIQEQIAAHHQARAEAIQEAVERQEEVKQSLIDENSRVVIQNGTEITSLASQAADYLQKQGFNITHFGPADTTGYEHTVIVVYDESKIYTIQMLAGIFDIQENNIRLSPSSQSDLDVRVIIGSDFKMPEEATSLSMTK
jgi:LCP family protein required for cell wall assembly